MQGARASDWTEDMDNRINYAIEVGYARHVLKPNSLVIIVTGWRSGSGHTNTVRVIRVPDRSQKFTIGCTEATVENDDAATSDCGVSFSWERFAKKKCDGLTDKASIGWWNKVRECLRNWSKLIHINKITNTINEKKIKKLLRSRDNFGFSNTVNNLMAMRREVKLNIGPSRVEYITL